MPDASIHLPVQIISPPDVSMRNAGTSGRFSLVSAQLSPGNETLESLPSPSQSRATSGHPPTSTLSPHRFFNTHDREISLTRAFGALSVNKEPRASVATDTDTTTIGRFAPHENYFQHSTVLSDSGSDLPADLETSTPRPQKVAGMDFSQLTPAFYIPMYMVPGHEHPQPGPIIVHLPDNCATEM